MRWTLWFVGSSVLGAVCLAVMFGTHHLNDWIGYLLFAFVAAVPVAWGALITLWALATDTNAEHVTAGGTSGH